MIKEVKKYVSKLTVLKSTNESGHIIAQELVWGV